MVPFIPPPPNCAARPLHVAGNATWKLIGFAVGDRSTGAMEPFTVQYAGSPLAASTHRGASSVTADTGSPIAVTGISLPSLVAVQSALLFEKLQNSTHRDLAGIAAKAFKESRYHARHCADWVLKLGDGTGESHARAQQALDDLWRFTGELFDVDAVDRRLIDAGIAIDASTLLEPWKEQIGRVVAEARIRFVSVAENGSA